jgi:hypothetical protein
LIVSRSMGVTKMAGHSTRRRLSEESESIKSGSIRLYLRSLCSHFGHQFAEGEEDSLVKRLIREPGPALEEAFQRMFETRDTFPRLKDIIAAVPSGKLEIAEPLGLLSHACYRGQDLTMRSTRDGREVTVKLECHCEQCRPKLWCPFCHEPRKPTICTYCGKRFMTGAEQSPLEGATA